MTRTRKISLFAITVTILALLAFQPGVIGGHEPRAVVRLKPLPALFQAVDRPILIPIPPTVTVIPTTTTTTTTMVPSSDATSVDTPDWNCIGNAESGNNYGEAGGGRWQFEEGTFFSVTGLYGSAEDYSPAVQDAAALKLYSERGFEPWIADRYKCPWLF
jgi:hypothetical protein